MNNEAYWSERNKMLLDRTKVTNKALAKVYKQANTRIENKLLELWLEMEKRGGVTPANLVQIQRYLEIQNEIEGELQGLNQTVNRRISNDLGLTAKFGSNSLLPYSSGQMVALSPQVIETIVRQEYKGDIFSNRIWKNTDKINKVIKNAIVDTTVTGQDVRKVAKKVSEIMEVGYNDSKRIVVTETNRVFNEACRLSAKDLGFDRYSLILEPSACPKCTAHKGEIYDINQSVLPFHPHCKCSIKIETGIVDHGDNRN